MAHGSPSKRWPLWPAIEAQGRERTPLDLLAEILHEARRRRAPNLEVLSALALRCAANVHEIPITNDGIHAGFIRQAHEVAVQGQWDLARLYLQHSKEDRAMALPWSRYPVPPDGRPAWRILDEIVFRAHAANPPNIGTIINLAFMCAANEHLTTPHVEKQTAAQDQHLLDALAAALNQDWPGVQRELDHD